jgi:hypothetical protein
MKSAASRIQSISTLFEPAEGQAAQQPCSGPTVEDLEDEFDLFTKSELVKMSKYSVRICLYGIFEAQSPPFG